MQPKLRIMSNKLRTEKNCLNCGHFVADRFCSHCGQENIETKETFIHQVQHLIGDITHFDSKFFRTVTYLFSKPGFLTLEYLKGKRADYVKPIQLFVFTSFIFFLFQGILPKKNSVKEGALQTLSESIAKASDTTHVEKEIEEDQHSSSFFKGIKDGLISKDTVKKNKKEDISIINNNILNIKVKNEDTTDDFGLFTNGTLSEEKDYIRIQDSLPKEKRDGFFKKKTKLFLLKNKDKTSNEFTHEFREKFYHKMHYWIFILFPFFALILKLFYRKKQLYFSEHLIFGFHFHTIILLLLLTASFVSSIFDVSILWLILFGIYFYLFFSLKRVFNDSYKKTILKSLLVFIVYVIFVYLFIMFTSIVVLFFS